MIASIAYMPPIMFFAYAQQHTQVIFEAHEHYVKQSYRNRCSIYSTQGKQDLILPVTKPSGSKTCIKDVLISYDETWQAQHWHAIRSAYNSSPFFLYYEDELSPFYTKKYRFLWDFSIKLFMLFQSFLKLEITISETSEYLHSYPTNIVDLRYALSPKIHMQETCPEYPQVFEEKHGFIPNLSILDLLCNEGPESILYLKRFGAK